MFGLFHLEFVNWLLVITYWLLVIGNWNLFGNWNLKS